MSRERLAAAYEELAALHAKVADQYAQVAHELSAPIEPPVARAGVPESLPAAAAGGPPAPAAYDTNECPKHHVPFEAGTYGPFCKQPTDDPAWGKQKGDRLWCRITPRNAPEYLRIQAAA